MLEGKEREKRKRKRVVEEIEKEDFQGKENRKG